MPSLNPTRFPAGLAKYCLSWEELHRDARHLAQHLAATSDDEDWDQIIAITRGGLIPAAILARELGVRLIDTICVSSYEHQSQGELAILKAANPTGKKILLVDDLVDTGKTAREVRAQLPDAHFVTLYAKPQGCDLADDYVVDVAQETWLHFPWDVDLQYSEPLKP